MYGFISSAVYFQEKGKNNKTNRTSYVDGIPNTILVHVCYGALQFAAHAVYFQTKFGAAPFLEMQFILSNVQGHHYLFFCQL